jgi:hypothetical protein
MPCFASDGPCEWPEVAAVEEKTGLGGGRSWAADRMPGARAETAPSFLFRAYFFQLCVQCPVTGVHDLI